MNIAQISSFLPYKSKNPEYGDLPVSQHSAQPTNFNSENPFGVLGFKGKYNNTLSERLIKTYNCKEYNLIEIFIPPNYKLNGDGRAKLMLDAGELKLNFDFHKCPNNQEKILAASVGICTAIKKAVNVGISKINIETANQNDIKFLQMLYPDAKVSDKSVVTLPEESFDKILRRTEKIIRKTFNNADTQQYIEISKASDDTVKKLFPSGVKNINFKQSVGDCYLLSTIKSLSKHPKGEKLITQLISTNTDGGYIVNFPFLPNGSFTVTKNEVQNLINAPNAVKTDQLGVKILEHGYYKLRGRVKESLGEEFPGKEIFKTKEYLLHFGDIGEALFVLTGKNSLTFCTEEYDLKKIRSIFKTIKEKNMPIVALTGKDITLQGNLTKSMHVYSICDINPEKEELTIINPDDTTQETKISYKTFLENFSYFSCVDL